MGFGVTVGNEAFTKNCFITFVAKNGGTKIFGDFGFVGLVPKAFRGLLLFELGTRKTKTDMDGNDERRHLFKGTRDWL